MTLVDSSVWIDYFNGRATPETDFLDSQLGNVPLAIGDLILAEVLQGFRHDSDYEIARAAFACLDIYDLLGTNIAIKTAENYRALRRRGITVRKTADAIIATYCIEHKIALLFTDRDFEPFVQHLRLQSALPAP